MKPKEYKILYKKGVKYAQNSEYHKALEYYDKALALYKEDSRLWLDKALSLIKLKNYSDSLYCTEEGLKLKQNDADLWTYKGLSLEGLGIKNSDNKLIMESIECYDKATNINPKHYYAWLNKAMMLSRLDKREESVKAYDVVLKLKPRDPISMHNRRILLQEIKELKRD